MHVWQGVVSSPVINIAIISWFVAQALKVIIVFATEGKFNFSRFVGSGGMPSSHAATVCGLTVGVLRACGASSPEFAIAAVFSLVVMYDAAGVRRAAGQQAAILNKMIEHWDDADFVGTKLKELLGHTPLQVFFGALLGILFGLTYPM